VIRITVRPLTDDEAKLLNERKPSLYKVVEEYALLFIGIYVVLLIPLLLTDHFIPISSDLQFIVCIVLFFLTAFIVHRISKKYSSSNNKAFESKKVAEVLHVKTNRAIEREDIEDFGSAFYFEVEDEGKRKTLFLWGQYLDDVAENRFPNSEFELIRKADTKEFINLKLLGNYFKPEKTLPAFDKELWKSGRTHEDGQIVNTPIDEIS
jgi:hypothetical protein